MADKPGAYAGITGMLFDPGGDVDGIRRAASACRQLSTHFSGCLDALDPVSAELIKHWKGRPGNGFRTSWETFAPAMHDYAHQLAGAGDSLDKVADLLHEAQVQSRNFKIALGATVVVGAAMTLFTFGLSDVAAAATVEAEAGAITVMMARLASLLAGEAQAVSALISAMTTTVARFSMGVGFSIASTVGVKGLVRHQDVLDPANYDAKDAAKVLLDGMLVMAMGPMASTPSISAALEAHPYLGFAAAGGAGSGAFSVVSQFWLDGASPTDPEAWLNVGKSTIFGGLSGWGTAGLFVGLPGAIGSVRWPGATAVEDRVLADEQPTLTGLLGPRRRPLGTDGVELPVPTRPLAGLVGPRGEPLAAAPAPLGRLPVPGPNGLPLFPAKRFPATATGLAVTPGDIVRGGTGLGSDAINYVINYPPPPVIVSGPPLPPPAPIAPDFPIPALPARAMPGVAAYSVQHGDSLWSIAQRVYGDGMAWTRIWAANPQIADPATIAYGHVLAVPGPPAQPLRATG